MKKNVDIIKEAVLNMGGTIEEFMPERGCFYVTVAGQRILLERKISITRNPFVSRSLTALKDITHRLLIAEGLPSPKTECFYKKTYNAQQARIQLQSLPYPIILKDAGGSNSRGIFPFIKDVREAARVLARELPRYHSMVAQEMVFGKEYRVLVLGNKIVAALEMIHPYVVGDGVSTIKQLISAKQDVTDRRTVFDDKLKHILSAQHLTLARVLPLGFRVTFKKNASLAEGGETRDVTGLVHADIVKACVAASAAVGKFLVGIDIMCEDISKKPTKKTFSILEVNGKPDLYIHYNPTHGKTRDVVKDIVKFMVKLADKLEL